MGDIKELYQLKKPPLSASIYLTPWTSGKNLVTPIPALKKRFKHGWFIVDDDWASTVEFRGRVSHVRTSYNSKNIMWSKKDYPIKKIRDFVASHKTKLAKRGDMLNEKRLIKFQLVEKRFLSDDHIRSMMGIQFPSGVSRSK